MLVSDFKETDGYRFDFQTLLLIPNNCYECGMPLDINPTLTGLTCTNPRCVDKITLRTVAMFNQLGVVDFGEPTIKKLVKTFNIDNPMLFFMLESSDWDSVSEDLYNDSLKRKTENLLQQLSDKREMTLINYIKYSNLPNLQTSADSLFEGVLDLEDFYTRLDYEGVDFIQNQLGIKRELSLKSINLYNTLIEYREDLFEVVNSDFITIIEDVRADVKIKAVCTDEVGGGFKRKADFYNYIEENYGSKIYIDWGKSATKTMDVLIWAGADGTPARYTNKVEKTETWRSKGENIPILTASDFLTIIESSSDGQSVLDTLKSM